MYQQNQNFGKETMKKGKTNLCEIKNDEHSYKIHATDGQRALSRSKSKLVNKKNQKNSKNGWTQKQNILLQQYYNSNGPVWKLFKDKFHNKSTSDLKNRFNNSLRKIATKLSKLQPKGSARNAITSHTISAMLNYCFQIQDYLHWFNLTPNPEALVFRFKSDMIRMSLQEENQPEELAQLLRVLRAVNCRLRCYGVFKVKNQKLWKLSLNNFKSLLVLDNLCLEKDIAVNIEKQNLQSTTKSQKQTQDNLFLNFQPFHQIQAKDIQLIEFTDDQQVQDQSPQNNPTQAVKFSNPMAINYFSSDVCLF